MDSLMIRVIAENAITYAQENRDEYEKFKNSLSKSAWERIKSGESKKEDE